MSERRITCSNMKCGVPFTVPEHVYHQAQYHGEKRTLWCPSCGFSMAYQETEADRLKVRVSSLTADLEYTRNSRARAWRQVAYWKGQVTRLKRGRR